MYTQIKVPMIPVKIVDGNILANIPEGELSQ